MLCDHFTLIIVCIYIYIYILQQKQTYIIDMGSLAEKSIYNNK